MENVICASVIVVAPREPGCHNRRRGAPRLDIVKGVAARAGFARDAVADHVHDMIREACIFITGCFRNAQ